MDKKERQTFNHYMEKIRDRTFDEYDIYSFLILVRPYVTGWIHEFSDLIAHRVREKGKIFNLIEQVLCNADDSGEITLDMNGKVDGYRGMQKNTLQNELKQFFIKQGYQIDREILDEIVLCIFSITQSSVYKVDNLGEGKIQLISPPNGALYLCTSIKYGDELRGNIVFTQLDNNPIKTEFLGGWIKEPIEVIREGGTLIVNMNKRKIS